MSVRVQKNCISCIVWPLFRYSNDPEYHEEFDKAVQIHAGDLEPDFHPAGTVFDYEYRGTTVYTEAALLTETEVQKLTGVTSSALKLKDLTDFGLVKNEHGEKQKFFLMSLAGLDCGTIHSMRRIRMYSTLELTKRKALLENQLNETQPEAVMKANYDQMLVATPSGLKCSTRFQLETLAEWKTRAEEIEAGRELKEQFA